MSDWIIFKNSPIHGVGGFAKATVPAGARVIEYTGQKITKQESLRRCEENNWCLFSLGDEFDLDGAVGWNPARFINHSCSPNCEAELIDGRVWIIACREIPAGAEISFNYGYDLEFYKEHPCNCGAANCVGYIVAEDFFEHVRRQKVKPEFTDGAVGWPAKGLLSPALSSLGGGEGEKLAACSASHSPISIS